MNAIPTAREAVFMAGMLSRDGSSMHPFPSKQRGVLALADQPVDHPEHQRDGGEAEEMSRARLLDVEDDELARQREQRDEVRPWFG